MDEKYNHYLDKRKDIMKTTQFKVEDEFGDIISKDNFSQEQIIEPNNFLAKKNVKIYIKTSFILFNKRKDKIKTLILNQVLLQLTTKLC